MSLEENKAIQRQHIEEVFNKGNVEWLDTHYAPNIPAREHNSLEEYRDRVRWFHAAGPGLHLTILDMVAEGDKVAMYWEAAFTYSVVPTPALDAMPPLGKPVKWKGLNIVRIVDGKIVEMNGANEWTNMLVANSVYTLVNPDLARS